MHKKFFIKVITSYRNAGDLLINRALIENLSQHGQVYIDRKNCPDFFYEQLTKEIENIVPVQSFYKTLLIEALKNLGSVSLVTIPGHFFGVGIKKALITFLTGCFFIFLGLIKVKVLKFGGCVGPFDFSVKFAEKFRAWSFNYYGLRDELSRGNLNSKHAQYFPDLAFASSDIQRVFNSPKINEEQYVVFSFREQTNAMGSAQNYKEKVIKQLESLESSIPDNWKLVFCQQVPSDQKFSAELYEHFVQKGKKCELLSDTLDLDASLILYKNASLVASNRLHILLPALVMEVPHIGLIDKTEHHKILGIYRDNDIEKYIIDMDEDIEPSFIQDVLVSPDTQKQFKSISIKNAEECAKKFKQYLS